MLGDDLLEGLKFDELETLCHLTRSERYQRIMQAVQQALDEPDTEGAVRAWTGPSEEAPSYK